MASSSGDNVVVSPGIDARDQCVTSDIDAPIDGVNNRQDNSLPPSLLLLLILVVFVSFEDNFFSCVVYILGICLLNCVDSISWIFELAVPCI